MKAVKTMFHRQLINVCAHVNVSAYVHNQRQSLVSGVSNFCEMVNFYGICFITMTSIQASIYKHNNCYGNIFSSISLTHTASSMTLTVNKN